LLSNSLSSVLLFVFPYDGKQIGEKGDDAIREISGGIRDVSGSSRGFVFVGTPGTTDNSAISLTPQNNIPVLSGSTVMPAYRMNFSTGDAVPTSYENTPVWIGALICITY
jgi:hypothetical protein